jgi:peptidyl-prolyl isomerase D
VDCSSCWIATDGTRADVLFREFKAGNIENALDMFSKGLRYLDEHPVVPEDQPVEVKNTFESL